jgi:CheY-like chemotaxis protein
LLQVEVQPGLAELPVAPLALRSILLTILSVALPRAHRQPVVISASQLASELAFSVMCSANPLDQAPLADKELASLEMAQNLARFYGAQLVLPNPAAADFVITLALPAPEQRPVLVIDDNADWLALLQRYAAGSPYRVIGTSEPESARSLAEKIQPTVIFLDVMMHNVDGWQILSELRHAPTINRTPIVICTILPVKELALSLGASAFLQKPITQQQFLQSLEQHLARG